MKKRAREQESAFKRTYVTWLLSRRKMEKPRMWLSLERDRSQSVRDGGVNLSHLDAPPRVLSSGKRLKGWRERFWEKS